jgi:hypothetical protein
MKTRRLLRESQMPSYTLLLEATSRLLAGQINIATYEAIRDGAELLSDYGGSCTRVATTAHPLGRVAS